MFHFQDNTTLVSKFGLDNNPEVAAATSAIADKLERLCGKVHEQQLAAVYYALSQSSASVLRGALISRGVKCDEHMALTHMISRDDLTGTVTIVTSQPEGLKDRDNLPLNFHWTTTVASVASLVDIVEYVTDCCDAKNEADSLTYYAARNILHA